MDFIGENIVSFCAMWRICNGDGRFHADSSKKDLYGPVQATRRARHCQLYLELQLAISLGTISSRADVLNLFLLLSIRLVGIVYDKYEL
jgi:hypothetical protein